MTELLDRLDESAASAVSTVGVGEIVGWACIAIGGTTAVLSGGVVVALYYFGNLMTVGDLW